MFLAADSGTVFFIFSFWYRNLSKFYEPENFSKIFSVQFLYVLPIVAFLIWYAETLSLSVCKSRQCWNKQVLVSVFFNSLEYNLWNDICINYLQNMTEGIFSRILEITTKGLISTKKSQLIYILMTFHKIDLQTYSLLDKPNKWTNFQRSFFKRKLIFKSLDRRRSEN